MLLAGLATFSLSTGMVLSVGLEAEMVAGSGSAMFLLGAGRASAFSAASEAPIMVEADRAKLNLIFPLDFFMNSALGMDKAKHFI
jgi:hypothetical protein